jgi:hypothetical protein
MLLLKEPSMQRKGAKDLRVAANRGDLPVQSNPLLLDIKLHRNRHHHLHVIAAETLEE